MIKLFFNPFTRATRIRWMLEELGVPFELDRLEFEVGDFERRDFLAANPLGLLPTMLEGDYALFESGAICMYLADRFPEKHLAPAPSDIAARGLYYQWMVFCATELDSKLSEIYGQREHYEDERKNALAERTEAEAFRERAALVDAHLRTRPYMMGDGFSAVDVMVGSVLDWADSLGLVEGFDSIQAYLDRLETRPAHVRSLEG